MKFRKEIEIGKLWIEFHNDDISLNICYWWGMKHLCTFRVGKLGKYVSLEFFDKTIFFINYGKKIK